MERIISLLLYPIKQNLVFFCFMYCLGVLQILIQTFGLDLKLPKFDFLSYVLDLYVICLGIMLFPPLIRKWIRLFVVVFLYALAVVNVFCVSYFSAKLGPEILNVVLETDERESSEFISKYVTFKLFFSPLLVIIILIQFHLLFKYYYRIVKSFIKRSLLLNSSVIRKSVQIVISICIVVCILFCAQSRINLVKLVFAQTILEADAQVDNFTLNTPLNNLIFALKMRHLAKLDLGILADNQRAFTIESCAYTSDNIVLVIGESYIKSHSHLYGYEKNTTPYQEDMANSNKLVAFQDVVSPSNLTSVVFRNIFSLHSIDDDTDWSEYPLFPVLFRKAGYSVTFITNQFVKSIKEDVFNFSGGLFLNDKRLSDCQFDRRNTSTHRFDGGLIEDYDSLKQFRGKYNFIIFHLAGQHIDFNKRCPDDMRAFHISDYAHRQDLSDEERQVVADYDNATLYNDKVIEMIVKKFEEENAIVIYMPDHGEECYDEIHRMGRIPSGNFSPEMARQEYRIPFWIWCSQKYINNHPTIFSQIRQAVNRPFMTDDLPHMLLYLAGIKTSYYIEKRNLISDNYDSTRKRMIEGKVDYDNLQKQMTFE